MTQPDRQKFRSLCYPLALNLPKRHLEAKLHRPSGFDRPICCEALAKRKASYQSLTGLSIATFHYGSMFHEGSPLARGKRSYGIALKFEGAGLLSASQLARNRHPSQS